MDLKDVGQLVVALTGLLGLFIGLRATKRGEKKADAQERIAREAAEHEREFERNQAALETAYRMLAEQRTETDRANAALAAAREEHKVDRAEQGTEVERIRAQCVATQLRLTNTITALIAIVHDEVAVSAAETELAIANRHTLTDH